MQKIEKVAPDYVVGGARVAGRPDYSSRASSCDRQGGGMRTGDEQALTDNDFFEPLGFTEGAQFVRNKRFNSVLKLERQDQSVHAESDRPAVVLAEQLREDVEGHRTN